MDQTGTEEIDLKEFQDFMLLYPSTDPTDIIRFWKHNLVGIALYFTKKNLGDNDFLTD